MLRKKYIYISLLLGIGFLLQSCSGDTSYADLVKKERTQIASFLSSGALVKDDEIGDTILYVPGNIQVISESEFAAQDSTTDVSKNQYVKLDKSGIYMQIVRKGPGSKLANGSSATIINRYIEFNIAGDSIQTRNNSLPYAQYPDIMSCSKSLGTYTGSFISGIMYTYYNSSSVPAGWLVPLSYINLGRQDSPDTEIAKVKLIVPHTQGQTDASSNVYPCYYEITYELGK